MASQTAGIQQLLAAEKRAAEKIDDAKKKKLRRLKQAKDEALAEIDCYRGERERQYKDHEQKLLGSKSDTESTIQAETEKRIADFRKLAATKNEDAVRMLLSLVADIKPQLHPNYHPGIEPGKL